uniref:Leucine-rich repeat-containing N-terminal plant-type domain-containing protein n=2 Tax=Trieres chinensis TaxID=1514140 RepID=A0A7S2A8M2_TRICV
MTQTESFCVPFFLLTEHIHTMAKQKVSNSAGSETDSTCDDNNHSFRTTRSYETAEVNVERRAIVDGGVGAILGHDKINHATDSLGLIELDNAVDHPVTNLDPPDPPPLQHANEVEFQRPARRPGAIWIDSSGATRVPPAVVEDQETPREVAIASTSCYVIVTINSVVAHSFAWQRIKERIRDMALTAPVVEGIPIPNPPDATDKSLLQKAACYHHTQITVGIIICVLFGAIVGAIASVVTMNGAHVATEKNDYDALLQNHSDYFKELWKAVGIISTKDFLSDPESSQFAALSWMAYEDKLGPFQVGSDKAIQRYVMALFYFATHGEHWFGVKPSQAASTHCNIYSSTCWDNFEGIEMERAEAVPYLSTEWHECHWEGVGCYEESDIVGAISMIDHNLTGSIPTDISALLKLQHLQLQKNKIVGTIPDSFRNMGSLKSLLLSLNDFTGSIPDIFQALPDIAYLGFSGNPLTGTIPPSINGLKSLKRLYAAFTGLNGTLPFDFNTLPSLEYLVLHQNNFSGPIPSSIGDWKNPTYLTISGSSLTGTIPDSIGRLSSIKVIYLGANFLSGTIPPSLFGLKELRALALGENLISGTVPDEVGNSTHLQRLIMDNMLLEGSIPSSMGNLRELSLLRLDSNNLTGTVPASIGNNTLLKYLVVRENNLSGTLPETLKNVSQFELVDVSRNDLTGSINFFCNKGISYISADCGSSSPEVVCSCCSFCCDDIKDDATCKLDFSDIALCRGSDFGTVVCGGG